MKHQIEQFFWNLILPQLSFEEKQVRYQMLKYETERERLLAKFKKDNIQYRGPAIVVLKT